MVLDTGLHHQLRYHHHHLDQQATAVAITTSKGGVKSLKEIRIMNPGSGYDTNNPPLIILNGGGGAGAAITFGIVDSGISTISSSC